MTQPNSEENQVRQTESTEIKLPAQSVTRLFMWAILIAAAAILAERTLTWAIAHSEAGRNLLKRFDLATLLSLAGAAGVVIRFVWGQVKIYTTAFERLRQRTRKLEEKLATYKKASLIERIDSLEREIVIYNEAQLLSRLHNLERDVVALKGEDSDFKAQCNQNREDILSLGFRYDFWENRLNQMENELKKKN